MDNTQVATKADLVVLKSELKIDIRAVKSDIKSLRQDTLKIEERVEKLEEGQEMILSILKRMENTLDGFVGKVDDLTIGTHQAREIKQRVDDHEKRLKRIASLKHIS